VGGEGNGNPSRRMKKISPSLLRSFSRFYARLPPPLRNARNVYGALTNIYYLSLSFSLALTVDRCTCLHTRRNSVSCCLCFSIEPRVHSSISRFASLELREERGREREREREREKHWRTEGQGCKLHVRDERATSEGRESGGGGVVYTRRPRSVLYAAPRLSRGQEA